MKIAIIIINFDGAEDTLECLDSILECNKKSLELIKIYLVDNSIKKPLSKEELTSGLNIEYIRSEENTGFAEGNNIGIRRAIDDEADIVALINNDTKFIDNSLLETINYFSANDDIGIIGLVNFYYSKPDVVWQAGFNIDKHTLHRDSIRSYREDVDFIPCDYVPGSSIIIKSSVFREIGLLDKNYFAYFEEADFCLQAKNKGFKVGFNPKSTILHKVGISSDSLIKLYLRTRNFLYLSNKYLSKLRFRFQELKFLLRLILKILIKEDKKFKKLNVVYISVRDFYNGNMYSGSLPRIIELINK